MAKDEDSGWFGLGNSLIVGGTILGSLALIGWIVTSVTHNLAGKNTHVTVNLAVTVSVSVVASIAVSAAVIQIRRLVKDKKRLDERVRDLEAENERLRSGTLLPLMPGAGSSSPPSR